jgi:DNA-binding response OmpR family regulator
MPNLHPKKVLIVEDEERMGELPGSAFAKAGAVILHAKDGEEGFAVAHEQMPDLIILDIMLPGMDGLSMLHKMRKEEWGLDIPVIILTNLSPDDRIIQEVVHDEPSFYLVKANTTVEDIVSKGKTILGL